MEEQFEVKLCNSVLAFILGMLGIAMLVFCAAAGLNSVSISLHPEWRWLWFVGVLGGGGYGGYLLLKLVVIRKAAVLVEAELLTVKYYNEEKAVIIPFANVVSYKYKSLRDREELCFKLIDHWRQKKISANKLFGSIGNFTELVNAVEYATAEYRSQHVALMVRERSFFEKRISTILLVFATIFISWLILKLVYEGLPAKGNPLIALGAYITYLGTWFAARERRNQKLG